MANLDDVPKFKQLCDSIESLKSDIDQIDPPSDQENIDPETEKSTDPTLKSVHRKAKTCADQLAKAKKEVSKKMDRFDMLEARLNRQEERMEALEGEVKDLEGEVRDWRMVTRPSARTIGLAQMVDAWWQKLMKEKDKDGELPENLNHGSGSGDIGFGSRLDDFARQFSTKKAFQKWLNDRDLAKHVEYWGMLDGNDRREARNEATHGSQFKAYAFTVWEGASRVGTEGATMEDQDCADEMKKFTRMFEYAYYPETWESAAKAARDEGR